MIKKLSIILSFLLVGIVFADSGRGHHGHHDDDEWTWSKVWCPGSSWTSTRIRKVCCKTSVPCPTSLPCSSVVNSTTTTPPLPPASCQTITATLWDLVADTLIICNRFTTQCPASFSSKATLTFTVKAQEAAEQNAAAASSSGMIFGAGLAIAGLVALFF